MTLYELSRQIASLKSSGRYAEALELFRQEKDRHDATEIASNAYLVSDMMTVMRKTGHVRAVFSFLRRFGVVMDTGTPERVLTSYGWVLYDLHKSGQETGEMDMEGFYTKVGWLVPILQEYDSPYSRSVVGALLKSVVRGEKTKQTPNWGYMERYLRIFDPERLTTVAERFTVRDATRERTVVSASEREFWFAAMSKALLKLDRFEECYALSAKALESLESFHHSNDLWFARRMALSLRSMGRIEDAIAEMEKVFAKKREWFIQRELAVLYRETGDEAKAFDYAIGAMNGPGDLDYKVGVLDLLAELLEQRGEIEGASEHRTLALAIRRRNGWSLPDGVQVHVSEEDVETDEAALARKLKAFWKEHGYRSFKRGKVGRLLHDNERGKDGFLHFNGKDYYFTLPAKWKGTQKVAPGAEVFFDILVMPDGRERAHIQDLAA